MRSSQEMTEETGYSPTQGARCIPLGWSHPNPAILDNRCFSYVVGPVKKTQDQNLDLGEMIETFEIPISEIPQRILEGEISHALMLNTFFLLALQTQSGAKALTDQLLSFCRVQPPL